MKKENNFFPPLIKSPPWWRRFLETETDRFLREEKESKKIYNHMRKIPREEWEEVCRESIQGRLYYQRIIPPLFTKKVVENFEPISLYQSMPLYSMYVFICSSLYYELNNRRISVRRGRKILEDIKQIFGNTLRIPQLANPFLFTEHFPEIKIEDLNIDADLINILNNPNEFEKAFKSIFNQIENSTRLRFRLFR